MNCVLFAIIDKVFSLKKNIKKILAKWKKILEKLRNFDSPEKWEPCICNSPYPMYLQGRSFSRFKVS